MEMMTRTFRMMAVTALGVVISGLSLTGWAQTKDFGVWTSAGIKKQIRKFDFSLEGELRTQQNVSEIDRWSLAFSADYRLVKPLSVGLSYQFIGFHDVDYADYQPRHRFALDVTGKQRLGNFSLSLRERMQLTTKDESDRIKANGEINLYRINPDLNLRSRLKMAYNIPHFPVTPSLSFEAFFQLNNPEGNTFDDLRTVVSLQYKLNKHHTIDLYGLYDKEIHVTDPVAKTVLGLSYIFDF
jgi:hypothetical protein